VSFSNNLSMFIIFSIDLSPKKHYIILYKLFKIYWFSSCNPFNNICILRQIRSLVNNCQFPFKMNSTAIISCYYLFIVNTSNSDTVRPVKDLKSIGFLDNYSMKAKREQVKKESSTHIDVCN
jgi:hypothetical protein